MVCWILAGDLSSADAPGDRFAFVPGWAHRSVHAGATRGGYSAGGRRLPVCAALGGRARCWLRRSPCHFFRNDFISRLLGGAVADHRVGGAVLSHPPLSLYVVVARRGADVAQGSGAGAGRSLGPPRDADFRFGAVRGTGHRARMARRSPTGTQVGACHRARGHFRASRNHRRGHRVVALLGRDHSPSHRADADPARQQVEFPDELGLRHELFCRALWRTHPGAAFHCD